MATVVKDERPNDCTIARFACEDGSIPNPPNPAWLLVVNGKPHSTYRLGEERALLEAYFRTGKEAVASMSSSQAVMRKFMTAPGGLTGQMSDKRPGHHKIPKPGELSAACKKGRCSGCYRLGCNHKCHRRMTK